MKGIVLGGVRSGSGKTTVALGLMAALKRRGYKVAPFKVGPDFIDPGHHARVTGSASRNLDGWMLSESYNLDCFHRHASGADIAVIEGVMGLFDGYDGKSEAGSTAQMAKWLNLPVLLVADAKSMARSAAAMVQGFENFDRELMFAGVLFNHVSGPRHLSYLKEALEGNVAMPCLGGVIHDREISMPERHLGLTTTDDRPLSDKDIAALADLIETHTDVSALLGRLPEFAPASVSPCFPCFSSAPEPRIGVARDNAFCFYYPDNLELLRQAGADLIYFSPVTDRQLPNNLDGIYFGGGYPELFAKRLTENENMRRQVFECSASGMPIYAECGGLMYLSKDICDADGAVYPMVGCFPFSTRMYPYLKSLGYREITLTENTVIGKKGTVIRGHEFHYSDIAGSIQDCESVYRAADRTGLIKPGGGYRTAGTVGSYIHLHFGSNTDAAVSFVGSCRSFQNRNCL